MSTIRSRLAMALVWTVVLTAAGCEPRSATPDPLAIVDFKSLLQKQGRITFLSWNGKWIGTDCDTDVTFLADGSVEMTGYGNAVRRFKGTYHLDSGGVVSLELSGLKEGWPAMVLDKDSGTRKGSR